MLSQVLNLVNCSPQIRPVSAKVAIWKATRLHSVVNMMFQLRCEKNIENCTDAVFIKNKTYVISYYYLHPKSQLVQVENMAS